MNQYRCHFLETLSAAISLYRSLNYDNHSTNVITLNDQEGNDCSFNYHTKYNKIAMETGRYFITRKTADSLIAVLDAELERCVIGKEIGNYNLTGRSGKTYTQDSLRGKVVLIFGQLIVVHA
jgi:hypothetical protein